MKAKYILIVLALLAAVSCQDFLNIRTEATMPSTGTDYTKAENIFLPVSAAYASMRLGEGEALNYVAVLGVPSDDDDKGSATDDGPLVKECDEFTYGPENEHIQYIWSISPPMKPSRRYRSAAQRPASSAPMPISTSYAFLAACRS